MLHLCGAGRARQLVDGLDHPEGVAWSRTEDAAYAGGEAGQIYRVSMKTGATDVVVDVGGQILGVTLDGRDRVIACAPGVRALTVFDGRQVHALVNEGRRQTVSDTELLRVRPGRDIVFHRLGNLGSS